MFEMYKTLSMLDIVYAAVLAFVFLQLILNITRLGKNMSVRRNAGKEIGEYQKIEILKKCRDLFPFDTVNFRGKVITKGMKVRITTLQKRIIEGEFVGRNDMNILCVIAGQHIIAHEIDKIEDITEVNTNQENGIWLVKYRFICMMNLKKLRKNSGEKVA